MAERVRAASWRQAWTAVLCLAVAWIHVQDQGGFPGSKTPGYVGAGYYALEAAGIACALLITADARLAAYPITLLTAMGVALGPLLGYVLSRGPGLPGYTDDRGNWTEPLGLASVAVEVALLCLAVSVLLDRRGRRGRRSAAPPATPGESLTSAGAGIGHP
jgi:hypothetical protein